MRKEQCRGCGTSLFWAWTKGIKLIALEAEPSAEGDVEVDAEQPPPSPYGPYPAVTVLTPLEATAARSAGRALHKSHRVPCRTTAEQVFLLWEGGSVEGVISDSKLAREWADSKETRGFTFELVDSPPRRKTILFKIKG